MSPGRYRDSWASTDSSQSSFGLHADSDINVGLRPVSDERCRACARRSRRVAGHFGCPPRQHSCSVRDHAVTGDHPRRGAALDARGNRAADLAERQRLRDADQHRAPDSAAVRNRRLLGLPAGARSRQSGAGRDDWPPARKRRPRPDAPLRRTGRPGGRTAAASVCGRCDDASALQVLPGGGRGSVPFVSRRAGGRSRAAAGRPRRADRSNRGSSARPMCGCW